MSKQHIQILGLIMSLKKNNDVYVDKSGMGYCACASVDLQKEMSKLGIESKLIYGKYLSDNSIGRKAKAHFKNLIANFPTGSDFHGRVKRHFVKNGNQLSDKGGHVGVLVGETVYDVTSAQFGLPISYPLNDFLGMWDTVQIVKVKMKPSNTNWTQAIQYSYKTKAIATVAQESLQEGLEYALQGYVEEDSLEGDKEDFYQWYGVQSKEVQTNSQIVSCEDINQDYMLHIDKSTPTVFTPRMPPSATKTENDTTARITVAPNLLGCMIGYARIEADLMHGTDKFSVSKYGFKGGYEICTLSFKHCLAPNEKLVCDAKRSQEHWLVSYNKPTLEYKPTKVGKLFVSNVEYVPVTGKVPAAKFKVYIEVHKEDGFWFSPKIHLTKGFHLAIVEFNRDEHKGSADEENVTVNPINLSEYNKAKQLSAAMLSHSDKVPKYLKW